MCVNVATALVEGAELKLRRPVPSLRPYLGCFWSMETTEVTRWRIVPDACTVLSIELRNGARPKCFLTGPRLTPGERIPGSGLVLLGVRLEPGVAFVLTRKPVHELTDRRAPLLALVRP